jgi:hypothetical protein
MCIYCLEEISKMKLVVSEDVILTDDLLLKRTGKFLRWNLFYAAVRG